MFGVTESRHTYRSSLNVPTIHWQKTLEKSPFSNTSLSFDPLPRKRHKYPHKTHIVTLPEYSIFAVIVQGGPKKRGHSTFSQISRKLLKISK